MTLDDFLTTLGGAEPPQTSALLRSLWHDAKDDWPVATGSLDEEWRRIVSTLLAGQ